jgi:RNA-binding protein
MLTGKQKRYLRAMGSTLDPVVQIGKAGVIPSLIQSASDALLARELIKVRVLRNSPEEPGEAINALAQATGAEMVQVIGHNGLLYKHNPEKPRIELPE